MFALSENHTKCKNDFQRIKEQVESIKMILRCGICCSTLRDPIMTTCNHAFCRVCLFECFKRLSLMRCPICNMTLNKRSCASCPLLSSLLDKYLPLAKAFKKDIMTTGFAKENDFMESQVPMTQLASSPLQLSQNQSRKLLRMESKSAKRCIAYSKHRPEKKQRNDGTHYSNLVIETVANTCAGTSTVKHTSCCSKSTIIGYSASRQLQMNFVEFNSSQKESENVRVRNNGKEMQHRNRLISMEDTTCSPLYVEKLDLITSAIHDENIEKDSSANKTDASVQMEMTVNSVFEASESQSRIEVLIKCMPWIPNFLRLDREELINAVCHYNEELCNENNPSKNGIDLVLESDEEREVAVPINTSYTIDCCCSDAQQSKNRNIEQSTVSLLKDKQCYKEDNEVYHSIMVSGVSKLSDQFLLREFLDNFSSFKLSTSINRKCTYLVIFNTGKLTSYSHLSYNTFYLLCLLCLWHARSDFLTNGLVCEFWTVKLIYALVNHCTIVSYSWLENCLNQKSILPTSRICEIWGEVMIHKQIHDFEILLKIDETLISITAQRALTDPSTLFDGHKFYVPQTFFNTQLIARDVFLEIVELSGGETVSHVWELPSERSYIIFAPDCFNQDAARRFELDVKKEVLKADWIFASIGQHRILDREPYRLTNSIS
uniref:RING-type E3 ubiquitin transferase BRCA1 n=1 Tax=Wuchereria bancrofti TaxID=6293 RepID=A0A1I8EXM0_WUCBA